MMRIGSKTEKKGSLKVMEERGKKINHVQESERLMSSLVPKYTNIKSSFAL